MLAAVSKRGRWIPGSRSVGVSFVMPRGIVTLAPTMTSIWTGFWTLGGRPTAAQARPVALLHGLLMSWWMATSRLSTDGHAIEDLRTACSTTTR